MKITYTKNDLTKPQKVNGAIWPEQSPRPLDHMFSLSYFIVQQAKTHTSLITLASSPLHLKDCFSYLVSQLLNRSLKAQNLIKERTLQH